MILLCYFVNHVSTFGPSVILKLIFQEYMRIMRQLYRKFYKLKKDRTIRSHDYIYFSQCYQLKTSILGSICYFS